MSVDVSTGAFYGVSINFEGPEDLPGRLKGSDWDEIYSEFSSFGLPSTVKIFSGGNEMGGSHRLDILLPESRYSVDKNGQTYPHTDTSAGFVRLVDPSDNSVADLIEVLHELNLSYLVDKIGWNFFTDIY